MTFDPDAPYDAEATKKALGVALQGLATLSNQQIMEDIARAADDPPEWWDDEPEYQVPAVDLKIAPKGENEQGDVW